MLTSKVAIWVESEQPRASAYHLHYLYNDKTFPTVEYINNEWFYLDWNLRKYYTKLLSQITTPLSFGLGTHQAPFIDAFNLSNNSTDSPTHSECMSDTKSPFENREGVHNRKTKLTELIVETTKSYKDSVAFGFDEAYTSQMATNTIQEVVATEGTLHGGGAEMYRAFTQAGAGGEPYAEGSYGLEAGGCGTLPGGLGQPPQGGSYGSLPEGPPGGSYRGAPGGAPGGPPGGSGGGPEGANLFLVPQITQLPPFVSGGLKGTPPMNFDGNRKNTKLFTQEFSLYHMINQDAAMMRNAYTRMALVLSFMRGPSINDWVLQQTEKLYVRCNGDMSSGIAPMHQTQDEQLWVEFGYDFH